uniref:Uncharacterized protein n=1 Tax=Kalanchoe fedtschenkoi TaxID=63787 RepID=A0A7N0VJS7_KALFE
MLIINCLLQCLFLLLLISSTALSEIRDTRITDDSRPMILFERFGFSGTGHVSVSAHDVTWKSTHRTLKLNTSAMGFFIVPQPSFPRLLNHSPHASCVLSSPHATLVFKFDNDVRVGTSYNGTLLIQDPDEYTLAFANCQPQFQISMTVHTEMYNVDGGRKDFLPAGETPLPKLYFLLFLIYSAFAALWIFICVKQREAKAVHKIHLIMAALLVFKALKMICASEDKMYVRRTGTPHGWDVAFYVFGLFKGVVLFMVIVLIGTGWSFLKPYLQEREKSVLIMVIPLQLLENVAYVVISETGPATKDWMAWNQVFLIVDVACCCAVFFPIVWSIRGLREASKTDGKAARNLEKLTLFKQFYMVVVGYLYFTRVVVSAVGSVLNYRYEWVVNAAAEGGSLAFYLFIFYNFQPLERNPYLEVDETVASQMLEDDDSFDL